MSKTKYIAWTGQGSDEEFDTLEEAEAYMQEQGFEFAGESASDAETEGGQILWLGYCIFWTAAGRGLETYPDGQEPRIRILHSKED